MSNHSVLPVKGVHGRLMRRVEPLAGHHIVERFPDGLDPLVLLVLSSGKQGVGVDILLATGKYILTGRDQSTQSF